MKTDDKTFEQAQALRIQKHQTNGANLKLGEIGAALKSISDEQDATQETLYTLISQAQEIISCASQGGIIFVEDEGDSTLIDKSLLVGNDEVEVHQQKVEALDAVQISKDMDWEEYLEALDAYASRHDINLDDDPFAYLLSDSQRIALEKRIEEEFSLKKCACDKYDYMIAGTCGLIGGLIDVCFVGIPGQGPLTKFADVAADGMVQKFAQLNGWDKGKAEARGSNITASAIGFLEKKFQVNYDQSTSQGPRGTGGAVKNLSMSNHHVKSLAHSPDLVGLMFSIYDQFTNSSHFVSNGQLVVVDTETFELHGSNFVAKVFCGFTNWFGHLFSDMAGSSGGRGQNLGRGSGIPIPFYHLLQFINIGEFGQHRKSFGEIAVKVFEQGYDFRHGIALTIPVLVTELLTRVTWVVKQRFYHNEEWQDCVPLANNPELRRMLLVAHGSLCLVDISDAALRCGGDVITFLLRSNLIAWTRFGTCALKELQAWYAKGALDIDAVDDFLDAECERLLAVV